MRRTNFICAVDGCGQPARCRAMCAAHYRRFRRYGDPQAGRALVGDKERFLKSILSLETDDCILSPEGTSGYWSFNKNGTQILAHRWVCLQANGPAPDKQSMAAHTCGNGHLGCVNPRHLCWKTPTQNAADKHVHGTAQIGERNASAKLKETDIPIIRKLAEQLSFREIARRFGVGRVAIRAVVRRKTWKHVA